MPQNENVDHREAEKAGKTTIFAVRTTIGQEKGVLQLLFNRLKIMNPFPDIKTMLISEQLRGYVFVEAIHQRDVLMLAAGVPHVKGKVVGSIQLNSITHVISPRRVTEVLEEGDKVEIVSGIFQSQKAQVIRMPKEGAKEEVTLRLLDSDSAISIKIHGDFLKLLEKGEKHKDRYIMKDEEIPSEKAAAEPEAGASVVVPVVEETTPANAPFDKVYTFGEEKEPENVGENIEASDSTKEETSPKEKKEKRKVDAEEEEDDWSKFSF